MSAATTHRRPPPFEDDGRLQALADELRRRGRNARVVHHSVVGDPDVRLEVAGPGQQAAELLDAWGDMPCGDRWQAVRVTPESRAVWCGPARTCPPDSVISFIEDLLSQGPDELAQRYTELG